MYFLLKVKSKESSVLMSESGNVTMQVKKIQSLKQNSWSLHHSMLGNIEMQIWTDVPGPDKKNEEKQEQSRTLVKERTPH